MATLARTCVCESKPWRVASLTLAALVEAAGGTSSARRRRERRLRLWAKHERLSVAMALAEKFHHSTNRTVLPKEEVEQHYAPRGQKPARTGSGTQYLFVGGVTVLVEEPQQQALVQRHFLEQIVAIPVPGGGGRLAGLQGFLPGQSSTAPQERISGRIMGQFVHIPGGGLQRFRPGQSSSSSSQLVFLKM